MFLGVLNGPEHGAPHFSPLGLTTYFSKVEQVSRDGFRHRERGLARQPSIPHDI